MNHWAGKPQGAKESLRQGCCTMGETLDKEHLKKIIKETVEESCLTGQINPFDSAFCFGVREVFEQIYGPYRSVHQQSPEQG